MPMYEVCKALASDGPAIERLYEEAMDRASWLPVAQRQQARFADVSQGEVIYVAKARTGELAAFVSVYAPESFIHHLFVAPRFQRQGLASLLLASLHSWLPLPWNLKCVQANTAALSFYAATGWQQRGTGQSEDGPYSLLECRQRPDVARV